MDAFLAFLSGAWHVVAGVLTVVLAIVASAHAVVYKRDSRSAVGWVGLIWLAPVLGAVLYATFGVNRIRRRAVEQRALAPPVTTAEFQIPPELVGGITLPADVGHLDTLAHLVDRVAGRPLTAGNRVEPLVNGDAAYPVMVGAISKARGARWR